MSRNPFIVIDGKRYRWREILDLRRSQLAASCADQVTQLALFDELHNDRRPLAESTAAKRYIQPGFFETS